MITAIIVSVILVGLIGLFTVLLISHVKGND